MVVTLYEYQNNNYRLTIKDSKNELEFKTHSYAQLYFFINNCMKLYNYDHEEHKTIYNSLHMPIAKITAYYSDTEMF